MAGIPSIAALERQLQYAKAREQKIAARQKQPPKVGSRGRQPKDSVKYDGIFVDASYVLLAPRAGINFFGLGNLGLTEPDDSDAAPRGFKPAKIIAVRAKSSPTTKTALSGRKYLKYTTDASGANDTTQTQYSAPISAETVTALKTKIQTIIRDKKDDVGEYGRIYFEPERPIYRASGDGAAAP
jgi:hypothetical protein